MNVRQPQLERLAWCTAAAVVAALSASLAGAQPGRCWEVEPRRSKLVVHVRPAGLFESQLHEHHFVPAQWSGRVCLNPEDPRDIDLELTFQADSLKDQQEALSPEDIERVEQQVRGPKVLDASRYPVIRYAATRLTVVAAESPPLKGTLHGHLSLRGRTRAVDVPVTARWTDERLRAAGTVAFKQSEFGIEPYSRFLGTVSIEDRVSIEFAIDASPVPAGPH